MEVSKGIRVHKRGVNRVEPHKLFFPFLAINQSIPIHLAPTNPILAGNNLHPEKLHPKWVDPIHLIPPSFPPRKGKPKQRPAHSP